MIQEEQPSTINCSTTITIDEKSGQLIKNVKTEMRIKAMTELFDEMLASVSNSGNEIKFELNIRVDSKFRCNEV